MSLSSWFSSIFKTHRPIRNRLEPAVRRSSFRPRIESLEDRYVPSVYYVNALTDESAGSSGSGSGASGDLRYCLDQADGQGANSTNTIEFDVSGQIDLRAPLPYIVVNVTLTAAETDAVTVDGNGNGTVFGIMEGTVTLNGLTITGGDTGQNNGGGIYNLSTLTLNNCTISGNTVISNYGSGDGGGIYNGGALTLNNCTVSNNSALYGGGTYNVGEETLNNCTISNNSVNVYGGGAYNADKETISNSTISNNSAADFGGGTYNTATLMISNSTFYNNNSTLGGGAISSTGAQVIRSSTISDNFADNGAGGIDLFSGSGGTTLQDTIVAGNDAYVASRDFSGSVSTSVNIGGVTYAEGYNLIGNGTGSNFVNGQNGDQVGTSGGPINPELGPLQYNGGPTLTMALLSNSPALNAGNPNASGLPEFDQRGPGFPRIIGNRADVGAYESAYPPTPAQIVIPLIPGSLTAGQSFSFQVDIDDLHNNLVLTDSADLTATLIGPGFFASGGITTVQAVDGSATFTGLSIQTAGYYQLWIHDPADGISGVSPTFIVTPASPAIISTNENLQLSATVGTAYATPFQVNVSDVFGNVIDNADVDFNVGSGSNGSSGSLDFGAELPPGAGGIVTAPMLVANNVAGTFPVTASIDGLSLTFTLTNLAAAPDIITPLNGAGQNTVVGSAFAQPLQALVTDEFGNPVSGVSVAFAAPLTGASGTFSQQATVLTDAQGIATAPTLTTNHQVGAFAVTASTPDVNQTASFDLTTTPIPSVIAISKGSGQKAQVATAFANPLQVFVSGPNKAPIAGITVVFSIPQAAAGGAFAGSTTVLTNAQGIATAPMLLADSTAGNFTVLASVADVVSPARFNLTNTAATPASVVAFSGTQQSATIGTAFGKPLEALVEDAFGNPVGGQTVTFMAPDSGPGGKFTHKNTAVTNADGIAIAPAFAANLQTGNFSVSASVAGVNEPASFSLSNVATAPTKAKANAGMGQKATVNQTFGTPLQVFVSNTHGQPLSGVWVNFQTPAGGASGLFSGLENVCVQTDANGMATAPTLTAGTVAGTFNVTATICGIKNTVLFSLTNVAGAAANVTASLGNNQSIAAGSNFKMPLVAVVTDAFGNALSGVSVTFTIQPNGNTGGTFGNAQTTVTVMTNAQGGAVAPVLKADDVGGTFTVVASVTDVEQEASFALINL